VGQFGALSPLLAPQSVAVIGASDREGNLGGLAVGFLKKFGYRGEVWPVNAGRSTVAGLPCFPAIADLPRVPDLAVVAVPAEAVTGVVADCIATGVPSAVVWSGGFAEVGEQGKARQRELEAVCRGTGIKLCGPNCLGIINTSIGLTASFSSLMTELDHFNPGAVSIVSQSGGIAITTHAKAQEMGLGFRATISCGNEAVLGVGDFIKALVEDDGTRVIALYIEGFADPARFIEALAVAREHQKPVVILKGGANEQSQQAALAHTGQLAGVDRTYDGIFREFAAIRVHSAEELLDVSLHLAALRPGVLPKGNRVVLTSFGGGSGVIGTDQCAREGLAVPPLDPGTRDRLRPIFPPLGSTLNPIDMTPGVVTNPKARVHLPEILSQLAHAPNVDSMVFMSAGFGELAPQVLKMVEDLLAQSPIPVAIGWQSPPAGVREAFAASGVRIFDEHARGIRVTANVARYAEDLRHAIRVWPEGKIGFPWQEIVPVGGIVSENTVAGILERAGLAVARGRLAMTTEEAVSAAQAVGLPVALKGISSVVTHRAKVGLVALGLDSIDAVEKTDRAFRARAKELGVTLDGTWVQHMVTGHIELLVTAFRDREFGVMIGCGMGGGMTEIIDDVAFTRAPIAPEGAADLLGRLRTLRRLPNLMDGEQRRRAADFISRLSGLVATAPWPRFTFEVNPLKLGGEECAAVDGLLVIE
jgi:acyl-CoA synthetase (NDP forming)